jgi:hypothetical protein
VPAGEDWLCELLLLHVVCGWQSIIETHPSADRCFIGKAPPTVEPRYIRATMNMEKNMNVPGRRI